MKISWDCVNHRSYFRHLTKNTHWLWDDATEISILLLSEFWPTIIHHPCRPLLQCVCVCVCVCVRMCVCVCVCVCVFTSSRAFHKSWSECWLKGSRFFLMVPVNSTGSCGMIDIFWRRSCRPISEVNTPSTKILPSGSIKRNSAEIRELFPAPVRPTIPTWPTQSRTHQCTVLTDSRDALELWRLTHLLSGSEHGWDVLEDDGSIRTVGEVDLVEGYQALIGPVGRGAFLGFPRCFAF